MRPRVNNCICTLLLRVGGGEGERRVEERAVMVEEGVKRREGDERDKEAQHELAPAHERGRADEVLDVPQPHRRVEVDALQEAYQTVSAKWTLLFRTEAQYTLKVRAKAQCVNEQARERGVDAFVSSVTMLMA